MAKRFTDTDKWKKPFVKGLDAPHKLLWFYILDDCDHAGIWIVDLEVAGLRCGFNYLESEVLATFNGQIEILKGGAYWFIRDFVEFQYGQLNPENRAHNSVINRLKKYDIKGLTRGLKDPKDKEQEKYKELDKEKDNNAPPSKLEVLDLVKSCLTQQGFSLSLNQKKEIAKGFYEYYGSQGWKKANGMRITNYKLLVSQWVTKEMNDKRKEVKAPEKVVYEPPREVQKAIQDLANNKTVK